MSSLPDWLIALISIVIPGFGSPDVSAYNGYVEADYVYVAPSAVGRIVQMGVDEGEMVEAGDVLFRIDASHQKAALRAATAQVAVAQANLDNLSTGSRTAEIDVIRATLDQARADQRLAQSTLDRSEQLLASGSVSKARVDADQTMVLSANARVAQLEAQLQVAELPARDAQRIAAEASHEAALAQLDDARSALADREVIAPVGGLIDRVFYEEGEVVGAAAPVMSILPPDALKALFFVPEAHRASVQPGEVFDVTCNGCAANLTARVTRLATTPQFTPPIIYSREERARLVFRAEAVLENADGVLPGQPLTLSPRQ